MSDKLVITAALAGAATQKSQNPAVPYTPEEFAEEARKCMDEGAAVVHVHARDPGTGMQTPDLEKIRATYDAIRDRCPGILINMSTGAPPNFTREQRGVPIPLKPELASLNTSTMNFALADWRNGQVMFEFVYVNTFADMIWFAKLMRDNGVKPECEIFDIGGLSSVLLLRKQGIFDEPMHFQFVFGVAGGMPYDPYTILRMRDSLPPGATWSVCGVGPAQFRSNILSAISGGHIRVGLEDNTRMPDGQLAKGSYEQVQWAAQVTRLAGREPASPDEARTLWNLPSGS
jgi:3-keto-5-aminohexanoate cleavage enzyme